MKLFLDDIHDPPDKDWVIARELIEFQVLALDYAGEINVFSFDHDLASADPRETGYAALCWLEKEVFMGGYPKPKDILIHSANPSVLPKMLFARMKILNHR